MPLLQGFLGGNRLRKSPKIRLHDQPPAHAAHKNIHGQKNKQGEQHNFFILVKNGTNLKVISSNLVANSSIPALEKQINTINSFDDEKALKAYYLEHLENNTISDKGGAGLGFITIGMKSGNKLKVDFKKINEDFSLFTLTSSVNLS